MLILVPTAAEAQGLFDQALPADGRPTRAHVAGHPVRAALTGFGPLAAAALGALALAEAPGEAAWLVGIAGTYDVRRLPVGGLLVATAAYAADVGRGRGRDLLGPRALDLPQVAAAGAEDAVYDRVELLAPPAGRLAAAAHGAVLTVGRASASAEEARACRRAWPDALAEEMEAFGVALAARRLGRSLGVLRGISNVAGDGDRAAWRTQEALGAVRAGLVALLGA